MFSLSPEQLTILDGWKRPADALPPPLWRQEAPSIHQPVSESVHMVRSSAVDLVQDAATDCSIVASLSAGIARSERGFSEVSRTDHFILSVVVWAFCISIVSPGRAIHDNTIIMACSSAPSINLLIDLFLDSRHEDSSL